MARLVGALEELHVPAGAVIATEGEQADALYLLARGRVRLSVRAATGDLELREIDGPTHFGELGLLLARRTATSRAVTAADLWRLPRRRFEQLVRERPDVGLAIAAALADVVDRRSREHVGAPMPERPDAATLEERDGGRPAAWRLGGAAMAVAIPALLWSALPPVGISLEGWRVLLVLGGAAIAWLAEPAPDFVIAIAMAAAWVGLGLAPPVIAFGGFATSTWLLTLGALTVAAAMVHSGLLYRAALSLLRVFPPTHNGQVLALFVGGALVTPLVPQSVARVAAVAPLATELAESLGHAPRSRGSAAIAFAALAGYWFLSNVFLTGFATNFYLLQLLPASDRAHFAWAGWLGAALPAGAVFLAGAALAVFVLFRPERDVRMSGTMIARQQRVLGSLSRREGVALGSLFVLIVGLLTQPFLGVDPSVPALIAACVALAGAIDRERFRRAIDWGFLVLFGVLLGSAGVLAASGVDRWLAAALVEGTRGVAGDPAVLVILLALATVASRFVLPSRAAIFLIALAVVPAAPALGISSWVAGFVVLVCANVWILPYQGLEYLLLRDATRGEAFTQRQGTVFGAALTAVRLAGVAASIPYWRALGLLG